MARFAAETSVPSEKSRAEIERTLKRYGADAFLFFEERGRAAIAFRAHGRHIRFLLPMPDPNAREFQYTPARRMLRSPEGRREAYEQAVRQRCHLRLDAAQHARNCALTAGEKRDRRTGQQRMDMGERDA